MAAPLAASLSEVSDRGGLTRAARNAMRECLRQVGDACLAVAFVSGGPKPPGPAVLADIAGELMALAPGAAVVAMETPAVIGDGAEREGAIALSLMTFGAGAFAVQPTLLDAEIEHASLAAALHAAATRVPDGAARPRVTLAFLGPKAHTAGSLVGLSDRSLPPVTGAGAKALVGAMPGEIPVPLAAAVLPLVTRLGVAICASPAVEVISPWAPITEVEGTFLRRVGDKPFLDALNAATAGRSERDPVLVAVRSEDSERWAPLVRAVAGVDARRGAVAVAEPLPHGAEVALAVRSVRDARSDFHQRLAAIGRGLGGASVAGSLVCSCAGRGHGLFGHKDVDATLVRTRFPGPQAGLYGAFELTPWGQEGGARFQLFSAVATVFFRPS